MGLRDFKKYIKDSDGLVVSRTTKGCGFILFNVLRHTLVWDIDPKLSKHIRDTMLTIYIHRKCVTTRRNTLQER